jgi:hypothetical protein
MVWRPWGGGKVSESAAGVKGIANCYLSAGRLFWSMVLASTPQFEHLFGELVVIDLSSPFVYLGRLVETQGDYLLLADADAHDLRDTATSREKYVLAARGHGINANRRWVWVSRREIVGISRLDDVVNE